MDNFKDQLDKFRKGDNYKKDYPETITKPEHVLLRFFQFNPNKGLELTEEQKKFRKSLIVPGAIPGAAESSAAESIGVQVTNIAKVIKTGPNSKFKAGDVVILGYEKVRGFHENAELKLYLQNKGAKSAGHGALDITPPDDLRKVIPNIERHLARYMYKNGSSNKVTPEDRLTYLMPDIEILSKE